MLIFENFRAMLIFERPLIIARVRYSTQTFVLCIQIMFPYHRLASRSLTELFQSCYYCEGLFRLSLTRKLHWLHSFNSYFVDIFVCLWLSWEKIQPSVKKEIISSSETQFSNNKAALESEKVPKNVHFLAVVLQFYWKLSWKRVYEKLTAS